MIPIDCFSEIKTKSNKLALYLEHLISSQNLSWQQHFGFDVIFLDNSWIQKELALNEINKIHSIKQLGLLRVKHKSFYDWHVDDYRQSCINCLVSKEHNSYCLFGKHKDDVDVYFWQVQGITEWHVSGETILLPPGDLLIIKKGVYHKAIPKTPRAGISMSKL